MNLIPKYRTIIRNFFKKTLQYGYRCTMCDKNATIICAYADKNCFDYVGFRCPKCKRRWGIELKRGEIKALIKL